MVLVLGTMAVACATVDRPAEPVTGGTGLAQVAPSEPAARAGEEGAEERKPLAMRGFLTSRYRHRWTSETTDVDVYATLSLELGDAEKDAYSGYVLGRVAKDVDGETGNDGHFVFDSIDDTYNDSIKGRLYEAYVDVHQVEALDKLRIGRQTAVNTPEVVHFDGWLVETPEQGAMGLRVGAYAGVPVSRFRSSHSGDAVFGSYLQARTWEGGRARLDWMHLDDEERLGTERNDLLGLGLWHTTSDQWNLHGRFTRLEERNRDLLLRGTYYANEEDLMVQGSYYELLTVQRDWALEADPFVSTLLELEPYTQTSLLVSKGVNEQWSVDGGVDSRRVVDNEEVSDFNRDFDRYFLTCTIDPCCREDISVGLTGELWRSGTSDIGSWGVDVTRQVDDEVDVSLGTYYSLYKYDYLLVDERDDVRTYYLKLEYEPDKSWKCFLRWEYEDDDFDNYQVVTAGARWRF